MAKESWSSSLAFIIAAIGSAVGLGNIWRFPYLANENGHLAFVIAYLISLALVGLPFLAAEILVGERKKQDASTFLKEFFKSDYVGILVAITLIGLLSYYLILTGWTLAYTLVSSFGEYPAIGEFKNTWLPIACYLASFAICILTVNNGIRKGLERLNGVMVPLLFILLIALCAYTAFAYGAEGAERLLRLDASFLMSPATWIAALSQVFFSLSIGMGVMITYASYMKKEENPVSESLKIGIPDTLVALMSSFIIFSFLFSNSIEIKEGVTLSFETLPAIFATLPYGNVIASMFYLTLFTAAATSAVSMLLIAVEILKNALGMGKWKAMAVSSLAILALSAMQMIGIFSIGFMDGVFGFGLLLICGMLFSYALSFSIGKMKGYKILSPLLRYIVPVLLAALLLAALA
jgi:NSS family neurotransmitter:Na+ symporter